MPRLLLQAVAVAAVVLTAPGDVRIVPAFPLWIERGVLLLAGLWFVNLVNFMDGLDWMTAAEAVPISGALLALGWFGDFPASATILAAALFGAMVGFAPFNRPVARIFLGDVGSLPIGLLLGWCLLQLAWQQQLAAALLLPLYYLADATLTLLRRLVRREPFWAAHRSHFYQRATDNGFTVLRVVSEVFALNIVLAALAIASIHAGSTIVSICSLLAGAAAVALVLVSIFAQTARLSRTPSARSGVVRRARHGQAQPFVEPDRRPPAGRGGLGNIELQRAEQAVMRIRCRLILKTALNRAVGSGKSRDPAPAALASRLMNSGVETCSSSASRKTSKPAPACASRCRMNEARFCTDSTARWLRIAANGSGMPSFTALASS